MKYSIKNASITIRGNTILDNINFDINDKDHIGILGPNGAGKTTLLKALIDPELFDRSTNNEEYYVRKIGTFSIGYQSQITFEDENNTLLEEVRNSFSFLIEMEENIEILVKKMQEDNSEETIKEYTSLLERFDSEGGYTYKKEYEIMLKKFGFTEEQKMRKIYSFSGGEKTKIAFIKLLLSKPDILFLDEPTNHLDLEAIEWLEEYLKNYKGAFVLVSHDRMFLNNTVSVIYDISHGKIKRYSGNYEFYEHQKEEDYDKTLRAYERQQKEIKRLHDLYEKFRNKPSKASMALSKLHMIERMEILEKPNRIDERTFKTNLNKIEESTNRVCVCKNLEIGYEKILAHLSFEVTYGDHIGIIGNNGTGKSTLLKTLVGLKKVMRGSITYGLNIKLGYFDQNLLVEDSNNTVLEEFSQAYPELLQEEARSALGAFLFKGDDVFKKIEVLSGGEKVRLSLCKILFDKPNLLVLDEPTNHMDIASKTALENILSTYKGTVIFVSHDRYFIKKITTKLIVFENSDATYYPFGYDEYISKKKQLKTEVIDTKNIKPIKKTVLKKSESVKCNDYEVKKEIKRIETEMSKLEQVKNKLNDELLDPNVYTDYIKSKDVNEQLKNVEKQIDILTSKWDTLTDSLV